jgi:hypothetical protein
MAAINQAGVIIARDQCQICLFRRPVILIYVADQPTPVRTTLRHIANLLAQALDTNHTRRNVLQTG